jgi:hypothetical protein
MLRINGFTYHSLTPHNLHQLARYHGGVNEGELDAGEVPNGVAQAEYYQALQKYLNYITAHNPHHETTRIMRAVIAENDAEQFPNGFHVVFKGTKGTTTGAPADTEYEPVLMYPPLDAAHEDTGEGNHVMIVKRDPDTGEWKNLKIYPGQPGYYELQYPVLFDQGTGGYFKGGSMQFAFDGRIHWFDSQYEDSEGRKLTPKQWVKQVVYEWHHMYNSGHLFSRFLLDAVATNDAWEVEEKKQWVDKARAQRVVSMPQVRAAAAAQDGDPVAAADVGKPSMPYHMNLPSSPINMCEQKQKCLTIMGTHGKPSHFITFTCNPLWPEITRALAEHGLKPHEWDKCPLLVARMFKIKKDRLLDDLRNGNFLGYRPPNRVRVKKRPVITICYVVEYQKRGLPHVHIAVRVEDPQPETAEEVDKVISAQLPPRPEGECPDHPCPERVKWYEHLMVLALMTHRCTAGCAKEKGCSKGFPKQALPYTTVDDKGYPWYKRAIDSIYVVPFCMRMLKRFHAHLNVEIAASVAIAAYLFKYIFKGADTADISFVRNGELIDTPEWLRVRYLSACEAAWSACGFHRSRITPTVVILPLSLPGQEHIVVDADEPDVVEAAGQQANDQLRWLRRPATGTPPSYAQVAQDAPHAPPGAQAEFLEEDDIKRDKEKAIFSRFLSPEQVDAVLTGDFDNMTYETFYSAFVYINKQQWVSRSGWFDNADQEGATPHKFARRNVISKGVCVAVLRQAIRPPPELFYMRILLKRMAVHNLEELKQGIADPNALPGAPPPQPFNTFESSAKARGWVVNNNMAHHAMKSAVDAGDTPADLRRFFVMVVKEMVDAQPFTLFKTFYPSMLADYRQNRPEHLRCNIPEHHAALDDEHYLPTNARNDYNIMLRSLHAIFDIQTNEATLLSIPLPLPNPDAPPPDRPDAVQEHISEWVPADPQRLDQEAALLAATVGSLNEEQAAIFWGIVAHLRANVADQDVWDDRWAALQLPNPPQPGDMQLPTFQHGVAFLSAAGGCGKTYLLNAALKTARLMQVVTVATAFTGLAANGYPGGTTVHRSFQLPVQTEGDDRGALQSTLHRGSAKADVIAHSGLIICDEAPMGGCRIANAMKETLSELSKEADTRHQLLIFSGDFQQVSPVVTRSDRRAQVMAWLTQAPWWHTDVQRLDLRHSMRHADDPRLRSLLDGIADGSAEICPKLDFELKSADITFQYLGRGARGIKIPTSIIQPVHEEQAAVDFVHADLRNPKECAKGAVLCTLHAGCNLINRIAIERMRGMPGVVIHDLEAHTSIRDARDLLQDFAGDEFLSRLDSTSVPPHKLTVCVGAVCMLMRNLAPGWTNGKRVIIQSISPAGESVVVVDAEHWDEQNGANHVYPYQHRLRLCRVDFDWKISQVGMTVVRKQFPFRLAYAVTFNKSQGQTLDRAVVDVRNPVFAHGQMYTAASRVRKGEHMRMLCLKSQVRNSGDPENEYISVVNFVERVMLEKSMPEAQRHELGAVPPDPAPPGQPALEQPQGVNSTNHTCFFSAPPNNS